MAPLRKAAILAGGAAARLGGDKAGSRLASRPLVEHVVANARAAGLRPVVLAKRETPLPAIDADVIREPDEPRHPLAGIVAALEACVDGAVVLACDLPLVPPALIRHLATLDDELAVCATTRGIEPLVGRYPRTALAPLADSLKLRTPVREAVAALGPRVLGPRDLARFGEPEAMLVNVNTRADLDRAESLLAAAAQS